jgi:hypothetical protein
MPAALMVLLVDDLDATSADRITAILSAEYSSGVISANADPTKGLVTILARTDAGITVDRLIKLPGQHGFHAREADDDQYKRAESLLGAMGNGAANPEADSNSSQTTEPGALISLADGLEPLQARFNQAKGAIRFIAILSPT